YIVVAPDGLASVATKNLEAYAGVKRSRDLICTSGSQRPHFSDRHNSFPAGQPKHQHDDAFLLFQIGDDKGERRDVVKVPNRLTTMQ
ncbi:hypothetical protein EJB05_44234, partial [Eragrostis curvula]